MAKKQTSTADRRLKEFHRLFTTPGTEYFNNRVKSYVGAGYKDSKASTYNVSRLIHSEKYQRYIKSFERKYEAAIQIKADVRGEKADQELIEALNECKRTGDMTNRVALIRIFQQRCGQLSDKMVIDVQGAIQLEERHQHAAKRIASIMVREKLLEAGADDEDTQDMGDGVEDTPAIIDAESVSIEDT